MANPQLHLAKILEAIGHVLNVFNFQSGSSLIERVVSKCDNDPTNVQLLANLKEELGQLPPLSSVQMNNEMRHFIQGLVDTTKSTNELNKKFVTRSIDKLYYSFEPFARNEIQQLALIDMIKIKEDVLGIELRHRIAEKLRNQKETSVVWQDEGRNIENLQITRELQTSDY